MATAHGRGTVSISLMRLRQGCHFASSPLSQAAAAASRRTAHGPGNAVPPRTESPLVKGPCHLGRLLGSQDG